MGISWHFFRLLGARLLGKVKVKLLGRKVMREGEEKAKAGERRSRGGQYF